MTARQRLLPLLLSLLALADFAGAAAGSVLEGRISRAEGSRVRVTLDVFYDLEGTAEVESSDVEVAGDGTFRVEAPRRAKAAHFRARIGPKTYYSDPVWLRGRKGGAVVPVPPIAEVDLAPVTLDVSLDGARLPESAVVVYFPGDWGASETTPISPARIECATVGRVNRKGRLEVDDLPRTGGWLVLEADGVSRKSTRVEFDAGRDQMSAEFVLFPAHPIAGTAPTGKLLGGKKAPGKVLIAPAFDGVASNDPRSRAVMYYGGSGHAAPVALSCGGDFEIPSRFGYAPVLCAWHPDSDTAGMPDLISASDRRTGKYDHWVEPTKAQITLGTYPKPLLPILRSASLTGNLWTRTTLGSFGDGIDCEWDGDDLVIRATRSYPATDFMAELHLRADGATIFRGDMPVDWKGTLLGLDAMPSVTQVNVVAVDGEGNAIPELSIAAFDEDDEEGFTQLFSIETDRQGLATAVFDRGMRIGFEPDRKLGTTTGGPRIVKRMRGAAVDLQIEVVSAFGSVEVTLGAIDDDVCRVSIVPDGEARYVQVRTTLGRIRKKTDAWEVELIDDELGAAAIRPGGSFRFDDIPEGKYIVAVEANLDLSSSDLYTDVQAARFGPHARKIEVVRGKVTTVQVDPPAPVDVGLELQLPKGLRKDFDRALRNGDAPTVLAYEVFRGEEAWQVPPSGKPVTLAWSEDGRIVGSLMEGTHYAVHVGAVGMADVVQVIAAGEDPAPALRLDGEIVLDLGKRARGTFEVAIQGFAHGPDGDPVYLRMLPEANHELKPRRGLIILTGLSPFMEHRITVTRAGQSVEVAVDPFADDPRAEVDKRSKALRRTVKVRIR